jgi:metal-responsive CopG/Arc/MetJ family transcriptional regulator
VDRLIDFQQAHHREIVSTPPVPLHPDNCLEVIGLCRTSRNIQRIADGLHHVKGIRPGQLAMTEAVGI